MPDDLYKGLDYEGLLDALAEMGVLPGYQSHLAQQMAMANKLRQTPMPEGRQVGRIYTAPHPFEQAVAGFERYRGMKDMQAMQGQTPEWSQTLGGLLGREYGARRSISPWIGAYLRRRQPEEESGSQPVLPQMVE